MRERLTTSLISSVMNNLFLELSMSLTKLRTRFINRTMVNLNTIRGVNSIVLLTNGFGMSLEKGQKAALINNLFHFKNFLHFSDKLYNLTYKLYLNYKDFYDNEGSELFR